MYNKKIVVVILAMIISNFSTASLKVLADEVSKNNITLETKKIEAIEEKVSKFEEYYSDKREAYDEKF